MAQTRRTVAVSGVFDDIRSRDVRLVEQAAAAGDVRVVLWDTPASGSAPRFPRAEREYFLRAVRWTAAVEPRPGAEDQQGLPFAPDAWAMTEEQATPARLAWCRQHGVEPLVIGPALLARLPEPAEPVLGTAPRAIVTGCFDWLHSGHVRFFEEAAALGQLIVGLGSDANIRRLKGEGHPLYPEAERRYMVAAIRHVAAAVINAGEGWLDAVPAIQRFRPRCYVVNEDGDRPEKRAFCTEYGLEYVVLRRLPSPGLPRRQSTDLRGF